MGSDIRFANNTVDRGYILFSDHASARACVEAGAARWSESERGLSSQHSKGWMSMRAYPESLVSSIIGRRGEELNACRMKFGAYLLVIRGAGLGQDSSSQRFHFVAEGDSFSLENLISELEQCLAAAHRKINHLIEQRGAEAWILERQSGYETAMRKGTKPLRPEGRGKRKPVDYSLDPAPGATPEQGTHDYWPDSSQDYPQGDAGRHEEAIQPSARDKEDMDNAAVYPVAMKRCILPSSKRQRQEKERMENAAANSLVPDWWDYPSKPPRPSTAAYLG